MSLTKALTEIADLGNTYKYRMGVDRPERATYKFEADDGIDYVVVFFLETEGVWMTGFDSVGSRQGKKTNPQKVLNTVFKITQEFYDKHKSDINIMLFHADQKRHRVYEYYLNKIFPTATIEREGYDPNAFIVNLK